MSTADKTPPTFKASDFTWIGTRGTAFASDLGLTAWQVPYGALPGRCAALGCVVVGRTKVEFVYDGSDRHDGGVRSWNFAGWAGNVRLTLTIFND